MEKKSLNVVFAGTPELSALTLQALLDSNHRVLAVYTQPDRPSGRGLKLTASPVKILAETHRLPVHQPLTLKDANEQAQLAAYQADIMVVAAYGLILPMAVLQTPRLGCVNVHFSLLPRWRGAAPIQRSILAGDKVTGITIMQMDKGLDTGDILLQHAYTMATDETSETLHDKLAAMGADSLIEALDLLTQDKLKPQSQDNSLATHARKITKDEAAIDWTQSAKELEQKVRAFIPWPITHTQWQGQAMRIWQAKAVDINHKALPGVIIQASREGIDIATGDGVLRLLQMQLPGGKAISVADFFNARQGELKPGNQFS